MARRGKTKVGGGPRQDTMLQAGSRGRASQERSEAMQQRSIEQGGDRVAGAVREGLGGVAAGVQRRGAREAQGKQQDFQNKMATRGMELEEAKAGFERTPEEGEQVQSSRSPEELAQLQEQGSQPIEIQGQGPARPGELRQTEAGKAAGQARTYAAETARMNAETNRMNAVDRHASARSRGDTAGMEAASKVMLDGMSTTRDGISDLINGKANPITTLQAYGTNQEARSALESPDPALQMQVAVRMRRNELASLNINYMAATGGPPIDYNPDNEIWQRYSSNYQNVASSLRGGQMLETQVDGQEAGSALKAWQGLTSEPEKQRFLNITAAKLTKAISQAESQAAAISRERQTQERITGLEGENEGLREENEMLKQGFRDMGSPEFGQEVPKTEETLPGGEKVQSGMEHRGKQYQPPGSGGGHRNPYNTSYKPNQVK